MGQKVNPSLFSLNKYTTYKTIFNLDSILLKKNYKKKILQNLINKKINFSKKEKNNIILNSIYKNIKILEIILVKNPSINDIKNLNTIIWKLYPLYSKIRIVEIKFPFFNVYFILNFIKLKLKITKNIRKVLKTTLLDIITEQIKINNIILGIKIQISGILKSSQQAYTEQISIGILPLQTKNSNMNFSKDYFKTSRGILGIKIWINY